MYVLEVLIVLDSCYNVNMVLQQSVHINWKIATGGYIRVLPKALKIRTKNNNPFKSLEDLGDI